MGLTAIALIYSPWGQRSGAHMNPAVTLTFLRLGKVAPWDAVFYIAGPVRGGTLGVLLVAGVLGRFFREPAGAYVATLPGRRACGVAFIAEALISLGLMTVVLLASNSPRLARFTGLFAGLLVALYITFEAPLSGMSMNPARTFASAAAGRACGTASGSTYRRRRSACCSRSSSTGRVRRTPEVVCAKLVHHTHRRCIFHCGYATNATRDP